jgi:thymidine kinase
VGFYIAYHKRYLYIKRRLQKNKQGGIGDKIMSAELLFKHGAMNSGKSTALLNTAYSYDERGLGIIAVKPAIDTKGDNLIIARAGLKREAEILLSPEMNLREEVSRLKKIGARTLKTIHMILVDEAQFLHPDQVDQLLEIVKLDNIPAVAYGLRTDFLNNVFPGALRLFGVADRFEKLTTVCRCGDEAEFNCRKYDGSYVFTGEQVAIDGDGKTSYDSLCFNCYHDEKALAELA